MYLTQYALIRSCGTVEYVYRAIIADFFEENHLFKFITIWIKRLEMDR